MDQMNLNSMKVPLMYHVIVGTEGKGKAAQARVKLTNEQVEPVEKTAKFVYLDNNPIPFIFNQLFFRMFAREGQNYVNYDEALNRQMKQIGQELAKDIKISPEELARLESEFQPEPPEAA